MVFALAAVIALALGRPADPPLSYRTLAQGADSRIDLHRELVLRTPGAWNLIWFKHSGDNREPDIDFRREMVVAVFGGRRASRDASVEIVGITREDGSVVVRYRESPGDAAQPSAAAGSRPFHIVAIPADRAPVRFVSTR
jgi:hypothetical protein